MKKKLISVLALVLVVCFTWVSQVDAASISYESYDQAVFLLSGVATNSNYGNNVFDFDVFYNGELKTFVSVVPNSLVQSMNMQYFNTSKNVGDNVSFDLFVFYDGDPIVYNDVNSYFQYESYSSRLTIADMTDSVTSVSIDIVIDDEVVTLNGYKFSVNYTVAYSRYIRFYLAFSTQRRFYVGLIVPHVTYGLTAEEKSILEQIKLGVDDANTQLDDMQTEQSSYYEEMITPDESNLNAAESMSEALESGKEIVDEYSSLNDSLEKPMADQLLPDYDRVVDGYVDTSIFDVFSTLYESGYIMFILLITCFFGVMSYALFGKKA